MILLSVTYTFIAHKQSWWPFNQNTSNSILSAKDDPNTPDPTYSSTKNDSEKTNQNSPPSNKGNQPGSEKQSVSTAITSAMVNNESNMVEIRAFVSGVIEGTGTCTATLTKGISSVTQSSPAFIDATTSQCEPIEIDRTKFTTGEWQVVVDYSSPTSIGKSQTVKMII